MLMGKRSSNTLQRKLGNGITNKKALRKMFRPSPLKTIPIKTIFSARNAAQSSHGKRANMEMLLGFVVE